MEKKFKSQNNLTRLPLVHHEYRRKVFENPAIKIIPKSFISRKIESLRSVSIEPKKNADLRYSTSRVPTPTLSTTKLIINENIHYRVINHKILKINLGITVLKPIPFNISADNSRFEASLLQIEPSLKSFYKNI